MRRHIICISVLLLSACTASRMAPSGPQLSTTKRQLQQTGNGLSVSPTCEDVIDIAVLASPAPDYDSESTVTTEKRLFELIGDEACKLRDGKKSSQ